MKKYDLDSLNDAIDAIQVAKLAGIEVNQSSETAKKIFIRCPEHFNRLGYEEKNIDNCVLDNNKNRYFCYSCKASGSIYKLLQLTRQISFPEAVELAASLSNIDTKQYQNEVSDEELSFPLSRSDLFLLDLLPSVITENASNISDDKKVENKLSVLDKYPQYVLKKENGYFGQSVSVIEHMYAVGTVARMTLMDLWINDKEAFDFMIMGKIKEMQVYTVSVIESEILALLFDKHIAYSISEGLKKCLSRLNELATLYSIPVMSYNKALKVQSRFRV